MNKLYILACVSICTFLGCKDKPSSEHTSDEQTQDESATEEAAAPTINGSFDTIKAFQNPNGELSLGEEGLALTLRAEIDTPIKLSAAHPKEVSRALFEYTTKDGKVMIGEQEFEVKLESNSMTPSRDAFVIPIDSPEIEGDKSDNIIFWMLELSADKSEALKTMCGTQVDVKGSATIMPQQISDFHDRIVYEGAKEIPVEVSATLDFSCD